MIYDELKKNFSLLSPTTALWVGFIGAFLALGTIGFIVLIVLVAKGQLGGVATVATTEPAPKAQANPSAAKQPADDQLTAPVTGEVKPVTDRDHIRGAKDAKVTLIEYSDYECPFCKQFDTTMKNVLSAYPGKVRWVYRHWPLSFHANSKKEAEAAECVYELGGQNKFWQFTDKIYERTTSNGTGFALENLPKLAMEIGLNQQSFQTCLDSGKYASYIDQSSADAQAVGIQGTPGVILIDSRGGKQLIKGALPLELMKQVINKAF